MDFRKFYFTVVFISLSWALVTSEVIKQQSCYYPGSSPHSRITFNYSSHPYVIGTTATYSCERGYRLLGPALRTCAFGGKWIPGKEPICVVNIAMGKAAKQSSTVGQAVAQKAVDGGLAKTFRSNTCTMTEVERSPWWYVNILMPFVIRAVRLDFGIGCCTNSTSANLVIRVGPRRPDLNSNPICATYQGLLRPEKPLYLYCTKPLTGTFISVHLIDSFSSLSICESHVFTDSEISLEQCPLVTNSTTATFNGSCYTFFPSKQATFGQARKMCKSIGGDLIHETSPAAQAFLSWELYKRDNLRASYWLGAYRSGASRRSNITGQWRWVSGRDVVNGFWSLGLGSKSCSEISGLRGFQWADVSCRSKLNVVCQSPPTRCGVPERPRNTTILYVNGNSIGSLLKYTCPPGNVLLGRSELVCLTTGNYDNTAPICRYVECPEPLNVREADFVLVGGSRSYMSKVNYTCHRGFEIKSGNRTRVCGPNGQWSGSLPTCAPKECKFAPEISNGAVSVSIDKVVYVCDPDYEMIGRPVAYCINGTWDTPTPTCVRRLKRLESTSEPSNTGAPTNTFSPSFTVGAGQDNFYPDNESILIDKAKSYHLDNAAEDKTLQTDPVFDGLTLDDIDDNQDASTEVGSLERHIYAVTKYSLVGWMIVVLIVATILWILSLFTIKYNRRKRTMDVEPIARELKCDNENGNETYRDYKDSWDILQQSTSMPDYVYVDKKFKI